MIRAIVWMLRATGGTFRAIAWMIRAIVWMLRAIVWMLRATGGTFRAIAWMIRAIVWMLRAIVWMIWATIWMLRAIVWMLRATGGTLRAIVWMLRATIWMLSTTIVWMLSRASRGTCSYAFVSRAYAVFRMPRGIPGTTSEGVADWRLPITPEEAGQACGSGCSFDFEMVWVAFGACPPQQ
eukprot:5349503-Pyramimonas_sp.AAC.1